MHQHLKNQSVAYRPVLAASAAPAKPAAWLAPLARGARSWCHGFCQRDKFVMKNTHLHRSMPAKTHATVRQLAEQPAHYSPSLLSV